MNDNLLTVKELAEYLKVSRVKIMKLIEEGMPVIDMGERTRRFNLDEVLAWMQEKKDLAKEIN